MELHQEWRPRGLIWSLLWKSALLFFLLFLFFLSELCTFCLTRYALPEGALWTDKGQGHTLGCGLGGSVWQYPSSEPSLPVVKVWFQILPLKRGLSSVANTCLSLCCQTFHRFWSLGQLNSRVLGQCYCGRVALPLRHHLDLFEQQG